MLSPPSGHRQGYLGVRGGRLGWLPLQLLSAGCPLARGTAAEGEENCLEKDQECPAVGGGGGKPRPCTWFCLSPWAELEGQDSRVPLSLPFS